ncbi:MAG: HAD-IC family P-type ATPase [Chitinivibrionales bacterium]|nr:HAD-IC family P-type ATPase [Chitinivibrionales bacterium]
MDKSKTENIKAAWTQSWKDVCKTLEVDTESGLKPEEAKQRLETFGSNRLAQVERESVWSILIRQFKSLIMAVLFAAVVLSFLFQKWTDGIAILLALLINAAIGFVTELRALRTMESLQQMDTKSAKVMRDGTAHTLDSRNLVPGDIVLIESGDIAAADMRVIESNNLTIDESALTGESVPVRKTEDTVSKDAPLPERKSMLFKGTAITEGSGSAVVVSTGMDTEIGGVSSLVQEAESEEDPLDRQLNRLATKLVRLIVVIAVVVAAAGIIAGRELFLMIETAIALFIAAVPEGLPIVSTVALARGMKRMAERNALVRRLSAVQTLGSTTIVFTDKTGTLTENKMRVEKYSSVHHPVDVAGRGDDNSVVFHDSKQDKDIDIEQDTTLRAMVQVGVLCNNASINDEGNVGDPMEIALLEAGMKAGMDREQQTEKNPEIREVAFDPDKKMMATYHKTENGIFEAVKGAPGAVLQACSTIRTNGETGKLDDTLREEWKKNSADMALEGMRVLGLAMRTPQSEEGAPYTDLTFLGLVGMIDPARKDVMEPIEMCRKAGVRVVMVTGDQRETAIAIGKELGLVESDKNVFHGSDLQAPENLDEKRRKELISGAIFARVGPKQKLDLIALHQNKGEIVAMTGDGVNDAPALKKADIGIAMGKRGQPVAEDSSDIILQDDRFATITAAIQQGRVIFENIRNFVMYMISGNIGEICIVFFASIVGAPLPLLPLQILYINIVNDIFPAIALAVGPGSGNEMQHPPRAPSEPIVTRRNWRTIGIFGIIIAIPILGTFAYALRWAGMDHQKAATITFLSIAFARLWHALNLREHGSSFLKNRITRNLVVWMAIGLCIALLLIAVYVPPVARVLDVVQLSASEWGLVGLTSIIPLLLGQLAVRLGIVN